MKHNRYYTHAIKEFPEIDFPQNMEDLLQNIIKESSGKQLQNLKQAAQIAHGKDGA